MGTRSLTHVFLNQKTAFTMYRQMDGYPSGQGRDLANYLSGVKITRGISFGETWTDKHHNGIDELAANILWFFKNEQRQGGIYLQPAGSRNDWVEYIYDVQLDDTGLNPPALLRIWETRKNGSRGRMVWEGTPEGVLIALDNGSIK